MNESVRDASRPLLEISPKVHMAERRVFAHKLPLQNDRSFLGSPPPPPTNRRISLKTEASLGLSPPKKKI